MTGRKIVALVALVLALSLAGGPVLAQDALPALMRGVSVEAVLPGSAAGSFARYWVDYAGGDELLTIEMVATPHDPSYASGIGFNVYTPDGTEHMGVWDNDDGVTRLEYRAEDAARLVVQAHNYVNGVTVWVRITARGAVGPTEEQGPLQEQRTLPESGMVEDEDRDMVMDRFPVSGAIVGFRVGAFAHHDLSYAGDESDVTIRMTYAPADPSFRGAFGFNVYSPSGTLVTSGSTGDRSDVLEATLNRDEAGTYLVQVYNYTEGVMLHYTLDVMR